MPENRFKVETLSKEMEIKGADKVVVDDALVGNGNIKENGVKRVQALDPTM